MRVLQTLFFAMFATSALAQDEAGLRQADQAQHEAARKRPPITIYVRGRARAGAKSPRAGASMPKRQLLLSLFSRHLGA